MTGGLVLLAAAAAAVAAWEALPATAGLRRLAAPAPPALPRGHASRPTSRMAVSVMGAVIVVALAGLLGGAQWGVLATAVVMVAGTAALVLHRRRVRRQAAARRDEVARACQLVAGLLGVGRVPVVAIGEAAREVPVLAGAAAEVEVGGDPAVALRRGAGVPGQEALTDLARAWDVTLRTGGSLRDTLSGVSDAVAADAETARTVEAELAAARMAGRIMAVLPLAGLGLGYAFGADPVAFLIGSAVGWVSLLLGVLIACVGVLWLDGVGERTGGVG